MSNKQKYKKDSFKEKNEESMEQKETNSNGSYCNWRPSSAW